MQERKTSLRRARVSGAVLAALVALAGCGGPGPNGAAPGANIGAPVPIDDPVVAFAASAAPGAEDTVVLPATGQTVRVRLVRAYAAASGRECREVMLAGGGAARARLLCRAGEGWREARPLLRDGTVRP